MPRIAVVGSINLDLVATAPALPTPGETVTGATFARHPGGKGANQALAARRMGADVSMTGCLGRDDEAIAATALLRQEGVDLTRCRTVDLATGIALIVVGPEGENQIVVAPGANSALRPEDVDVSGADAVVCQLEIPVEAVAAAVEQATLSILNCAPARDLPESVLRGCDVVVVNETERDFYGSRLAVVPVVVQTLGAAGAAVFRGDREVSRVAPPAVEAIDTVGAGDAFVGALAAELASGADVESSVRMATTAGALATTRRGAQTSLPTRAEVVRAMVGR